MKILLPMDDSDYSEEAMNMLIAQVQRTGTEVRVLHVVEPVPAYVTAGMVPEFTTSTAQLEQERRKQAEEQVADAAGTLRSAGLDASTAVDAGDPKTIIIQHAEDWQADLIVLGSHGLKGLSRFLMGSVSDAVIRHAHCSVQVVRLRHPQVTADI